MLLSFAEEQVTTYKKLDAIPAAVLLAAQVETSLALDEGAILGDPDFGSSKSVSFGRLNATLDKFYVASTGRSLVILQPGFQLLRAFPGIQQI